MSMKGREHELDSVVGRRSPKFLTKPARLQTPHECHCEILTVPHCENELQRHEHPCEGDGTMFDVWPPALEQAARDRPGWLG